MVTFWLRALMGLTCLTAMSCAETGVAPLGDSTVLATDERAIWRTSDNIESYFQSRGVLYEDAGVISYLNNIVRRLLQPYGALSQREPRVYILRHPSIAAFAFPNGAVYVSMGFLSHLESEAQVASVIAHELVHYLERHSLREHRHSENVRIIGHVVGIATLLGPLAEDLVHKTSVSGYSRELETEADLKGFRLLVDAGYDPGEALLAYQVLLAAQDREAEEQPSFFASHPKLLERMNTVQQLISVERARTDTAREGHVGRDAHRHAIHLLLLETALLDVRLGRYERAAGAVERHLESDPKSARGYFVRGQVCRAAKSGAEAIMASTEAYLRATRLPDTPPDAYRELGLNYRQLGDHQRSKAALAQYLLLKPEAVDAPIIRRYIAE
jgi:predicted Zn-dependent protease